MPKTLPREERAPVENYNAGLLTDLSTRISSEVQGLQELVLEVDGEQELGATPTLDLNLEVHPGRKRKRAGPAKYNSGFDLAAIQQALDKFAAEPADRLELEPYSKTQRKQVCVHERSRWYSSTGPVGIFYLEFTAACSTGVELRAHRVWP